MEDWKMSVKRTKKMQLKVQTYTGSGDICILCGKSIKTNQEFVEIKEAIKNYKKILYQSGKYHAACIAKRKYFIAFLDILGFTQFTQNHDLLDLYQEIQNLFKVARSAKATGSITINETSRSFTLANLPYFAISDSIIVFQEVLPLAETDDEFKWKEKAFGEFIFGMEELYKEALRQKIYLRGGISYGDLLISFDSESNEKIILGTPFIEAHQIEESQSWMGLAFHPSMAEYLHTTSYASALVKYQIPLKKECRLKGIPNLTVGWVDSSIKQERVKLDEWITNHNLRAEEIKANTISFFEFCKEKAPRLMGIRIKVLDAEE